MQNFTFLVIKIRGLHQFNITKVYIFLSLFCDTVFAISNSLLYNIITFRMSLGWKWSSRRQWSSWPHGNYVSSPMIFRTNHPAPLPFSFPSVLTHVRFTVKSYSQFCLQGPRGAPGERGRPGLPGAAVSIVIVYPDEGRGYLFWKNCLQDQISHNLNIMIWKRKSCI